VTQRNEADGYTVEDAESARFDRGFDSRRLHDLGREITQENGMAMPPGRNPAQNLPIWRDQVTTRRLAAELLGIEPGAIRGKVAR